MTPKLIPTFFVAAWLAAAPLAFGESGDDATITVVDEGDTPDDVVKVIELPARGPAPASPGSSTDQKNNGNEKKTDTGSESGQQASEDARNKDLRDQIKADAKQKDKKDAREDDPGGGKGHGPH